MLSDTHRGYVRNAMRHIEQEAEAAIALLAGEDEAAVFHRYRDFSDAARIARVRAHLARLRSAMRRFMQAQGIEKGDAQAIDAAWAFETRLAMARNAALELRPRYVRGYGALDAEGEQACRALAAELGQLMDAMARELRRGPLVRPAGGVADALLEATAQAIEHHHLLEYRQRVERLLARTGAATVEVALLGRVSSGKSSLVNALLGHALLPVGAVPVTAVTTRIRHGAHGAARTLDVDGHARDVPLDSVHEYIDEARNSGNHLRLREVEIRWPAAWLQPDIVLTDTPGLGSLHDRASAHALDYLPRCDVGIVTIDAASTLTPQDVDLMCALRDAGAGRLVLLSKADTVSAQALAQQHEYVQRALGEALGAPVPVAAVSVVEDRRGELERWRQEVLQPQLQTARGESGARHHTRVVALARQVAMTLRQALAEGAATDTPSTASPGGELLAQIEQLEQRTRELCQGLRARGATTVIDAVAGRQGRGAQVTREAIGEAAAALADQVVSDLVAALREVAGHAGGDADTLVRGAPPFVLPQALPPALPVPPGPAPVRRAWLRRRLQAAVGATLGEAYAAYARELVGWGAATCGRLRQVSADAPAASAIDASDRAGLEADLQRLQELLPH